MKNKISVVISAYNEEENIKVCLQSVSWADEIIVINNSSTDKTVSIAKDLGARVYNRPNLKMLNTNKNYGFTKASHDWILNLDADERVSIDLKEEILHVLKSEDKADAYLFPRKNIIFNKWIQHSLWWPDYQLRLFKKGKGKFKEEHVHEKIQVKGKTAKLKNPLIHYNYHSVSQFLKKMDYIYTDNEAGIMAENKLNWQDGLTVPIKDFIKTYVSLQGYKDGDHGMVLSVLQSFYSFVVFAKAWEKQGFGNLNGKKGLKSFNKLFKKLIKEYQYWYYQQKIVQAKTKVAKYYWKLIRKVKLI